MSDTLNQVQYIRRIIWLLKQITSVRYSTTQNQALEQGHFASVILMVDAVHLGVPNALDNVNIGTPFRPAKELLEDFVEKGGNVLVCGACMKHNGVAESDIDKRFPVISGDDVVKLLMGSKGSLQLN